MNTATICAHLMNIAYRPAKLLDVRWFGMTWLVVVENGASYAFLTGDGRRVFIVFRGSNDLQDFRWDWRFTKTAFPGGGRVHRGFHAAFMKVWPGLEEHLKKLDPRLPRIACGHSLGGAMVQETAVLTDLAEAHVFGCPRVGNQAFTSRITCPGVRWEARLDPVTGIPFRWGPWQAISALAGGRMPSMFTQPWPARTVDSYGHSSDGYLKAMLGGGLNGNFFPLPPHV